MRKKKLPSNIFNLKIRIALTHLIKNGFPDLRFGDLTHEKIIELFAENQGLSVLGSPKFWFSTLFQTNQVLLKGPVYPEQRKSKKERKLLREQIKLKKKQKALKKSPSIYKNKEPGIYKIECLVNGNIYIGSSSSVKERWNWHISDLEKKCHHNYRLQNDFNEFGIQKFTFEKIYTPGEKISRDELYNVEQIYINHYKPEYNIELIVKPPPKSKPKLSPGQRQMKTSTLSK